MAVAQVPRTADGHPDLQGFWNNASLTPLQRPAGLGNKQFFTPAEAAAYEKSRLEEVNRDRRDGSGQADVERAYNEAWFDRGTKVSRTLRTSLISDPVDGKVPALTPEAQQKWAKFQADFAAHPGDGPEDRPLPDRCLVFSQSGPPMMAGNYNDNYQIVQTHDFVSIRAEMGGIVRVIPLDGRPHLPSNVREWTGDGRGHWEGDTLVVDVTGFREETWFDRAGDYHSEDLHVVERYTAVSPYHLMYEATIEDKNVYTRPWKISFPLYRRMEKNVQLLEFKCVPFTEEMLFGRFSKGGVK
jgi:hypothetical protein